MNLRAHAKINLSLAVRGLRPDGYHELRTVFQSLALHDTLRFSAADEGFALTCSSPEVPLDDRNLVWRAARMVWTAAGRRGEPRGRVRITKRIPARGGLGGGSADAAASLIGWNRTWAARLPAERLRHLARELGADVPFFLCAGTALGLNRGDHIRPLPDAPPRWVVLAFPPFGVSTPEAFRWWDDDQGELAADGPRLAAQSSPPVTPPPAAGRKQPADHLTVFNDLERPVSLRHPELLDIREHLERAGAVAAAMTGSGSTVFGLFKSRAGAAAARDRLGAAGWSSQVTRTATRTQARPV